MKHFIGKLYPIFISLYNLVKKHLKSTYNHLKKTDFTKTKEYLGIILLWIQLQYTIIKGKINKIDFSKIGYFLKTLKEYTFPTLLKIILLFRNTIITLHKKQILQRLFTKTQEILPNFSFKKWIAILSSALFVGILIFILGLVFFVKQGIFGKIPSYDDLRNISNQEASLVYSADDVLIGKFFNENRSAVDFEKIPPHVIDALIATEDSRFMEHDGVDYKSLLRVFFKSILLGDDKSGGGSTLSQQLVKNLFGRKRYYILSMPIIKIREMVIASRIEEIYSKEEILALYLNTVSFGENIFGIENAAMRYFSRHSNELTIEEGAVLIGMLKANTYYNPHINPKNSEGRRNIVMLQMTKNKSLTKQQYDSISQIPLKLKYKSALDYDREQGYFLSFIKNEASRIIEEYNSHHGTSYDLNKDGLRIETTLLKKMQNILLSENNKHILRLQKTLDNQLKKVRFWNKNKHIIEEWEQKNGKLPLTAKNGLFAYGMHDSIMNLNSIDSLKYCLSRLQSAVLASDPNTGAIRVWIGGTNYQFYPYNRVLSKRQVGSTFKPIVYYTALAHGLEPCKYIKNEKITYEEYDDWSPGNGTETYEGYYSVRGALANSINTIAAQVLFEAGIDESINTAKSLGIKSYIPEVPSIVLGVADISLFEMVQAYASFANGGYNSTLYAIENITTQDGKVLYKRRETKQEQILDEYALEELVSMMTDVVNSGTARRIREVYHIKGDIAGKTGTTQNNTDGWFIGYTPNLVMGVWVGVDNPAIKFQTTAVGQGANTALPIWALGYEKIMRYSWGKQFAGEFNFQYIDSLDCEMWRETDETILEKLGFELDSASRKERKEKRAERKAIRHATPTKSKPYKHNSVKKKVKRKVKKMFKKNRYKR